MLLDGALHNLKVLQLSAQLSALQPLFCLTFQVYSSTEHLATPSNLSFSSDRSHSEEKEDRGDIGGLSSYLSQAEGSVERAHAGRMARWAQVTSKAAFISVPAFVPVLLAGLKAFC